MDDSGPVRGKLYLCATPIGNLGDITVRALDTLRECDLIAAEDTRRTRRLLSRYDIRTPLTSYREENREAAGARIIKRMESGATVALVSDAGTPGISDPGHHLVALCLKRGLEVEVLPGANACVAALVVSGLPTRRFAFEGFLPRKRGPRRKRLAQLSDDERTLVFYESPERVLDTLDDIEYTMGSRAVALARELTKRFEEVLRGRVHEVRRMLEGIQVRGEIVLVVEGSSDGGVASYDKALEEVKRLRDGGMSLKDAASQVAEASPGISRSKLYNAALKS